MMECGIIRDLMPSYVDGLTSEESSRAVEEHVQECAECRDFLNAMKAELESEKYPKIDEVEAKTEIKAFKKLKKVMDRMIFGSIAAVLLVAIFLWGFYENAFLSRKGVMSGDVKVTYESMDGVVRIGFEPKKDNVLLDGWMGVGHDETSGDVLTNESGRERERLTLVSCGISPVRREFDKGSDRNFYVSYVFLDDGTVIYLNEYGECERVSENDILTVEFGDKSVEVMLKELRTEAGAEKLR